jgi:hypothetical protein
VPKRREKKCEVGMRKSVENNFTTETAELWGGGQSIIKTKNLSNFSVGSVHSVVEKKY